MWGWSAQEGPFPLARKMAFRSRCAPLTGKRAWCHITRSMTSSAEILRPEEDRQFFYIIILYYFLFTVYVGTILPVWSFPHILHLAVQMCCVCSNFSADVHFAVLFSRFAQGHHNAIVTFFASFRRTIQI